MGKNILIAGYGHTVTYTEMQGVSHVPFSKEWIGAKRIVEVLQKGGFAVTHMTANRAAGDFPDNLETLAHYDAVLMGDLSADTLLLNPEAVFNCTISTNRLKLIQEYVNQGGGIIMTGGWLTFQGIQGKGGYHGTSIEEVLPVNIFPFDDRVETPEGMIPVVKKPDHPIVRGLPHDWPAFLGYNKLTPKEKGEVIMTIQNDPFLVVGRHGRGKAVACASSPAPHWGGMAEYLNWKGYAHFWCNIMTWLTGRE